MLNKLSNAFSDIVRTAKSQLITSALGNNDVAVIAVPRKTLVKGVHLNVQTAYTAASTGSVTVGAQDSGQALNATYFMDNTAAAPLTAGMKTVAKSKYFDKGGLITVSFNKGDSAADAAVKVFVEMATIY